MTGASGSTPSLAVLAPEPYAAWSAVLASITVPLGVGTAVALAEVVRDALGVDSRDLPALPPAPAAVLDPAVAEFAEQFVVDVGAVDGAKRGAATQALGTRAFELVQVLYVLDLGSRLAAVWRTLTGHGLEPAVTRPTTLWPALEEFMRSVARLDALDPVTTDVVRLRGARAHHCRLCQSLRNVRAANDGYGDDYYDRIDTFEASDIPARHKTALRLVDTMLWHPATPADTLREDVAAAFTPRETAELALDVVRNAANKIAVSLAADDPHVTEGVEYYDTDASGELVYGLTPERSV